MWMAQPPLPASIGRKKRPRPRVVLRRLAEDQPEGVRADERVVVVAADQLPQAARLQLDLHLGLVGALAHRRRDGDVDDAPAVVVVRVPEHLAGLLVVGQQVEVHAWALHHLLDRLVQRGQVLAEAPRPAHGSALAAGVHVPHQVGLRRPGVNPLGRVIWVTAACRLQRRTGRPDRSGPLRSAASFVDHVGPLLGLALCKRPVGTAHW